MVSLRRSLLLRDASGTRKFDTFLGFLLIMVGTTGLLEAERDSGGGPTH